MMNNNQPEALRMADEMEVNAGYRYDGHDPDLLTDAAAELRRQHAEIETLKEHLQFVERWANHHGAKPSVTAKEALSVIQHYPPIKRITQSYADGVVPSTPNPFERQPLTDEQIKQIAHHEYLMGEGIWDENTAEDLTNFARAVELAHGVGSKP